MYSEIADNDKIITVSDAKAFLKRKGVTIEKSLTGESYRAIDNEGNLVWDDPAADDCDNLNAVTVMVFNTVYPNNDYFIING